MYGPCCPRPPPFVIVFCSQVCGAYASRAQNPAPSAWLAFEAWSIVLVAAPSKLLCWIARPCQQSAQVFHGAVRSIPGATISQNLRGSQDGRWWYAFFVIFYKNLKFEKFFKCIFLLTYKWKTHYGVAISVRPLVLKHGPTCTRSGGLVPWHAGTASSSFIQSTVGVLLFLQGASTFSSVVAVVPVGSIFTSAFLFYYLPSYLSPVKILCH